MYLAAVHGKGDIRRISNTNLLAGSTDAAVRGPLGGGRPKNGFYRNPWLVRFSPVSNKTVNDVSGVNFNNQHCVELLAIIFGQVWLTNLKKKIQVLNIRKKV